MGPKKARTRYDTTMPSSQEAKRLINFVCWRGQENKVSSLFDDAVSGKVGKA